MKDFHSTVEEGEALKALIQRVFRSEKPKSDELFPTRKDEDVSEYGQVKRFLGHRAWNELDRVSLEERYSGDEMGMLSFLPPAAFAYYLPAFLVLGMQALHSNPAFTDAVIFYLTPRNEVGLTEREQSRFALLSDDEASVVAAWLEFVDKCSQHIADYNVDVEPALARYWRARK